MDLKDRVELEILRVISSRIVDIIDSNTGYDWRSDLKDGHGPMEFHLEIEPDENLDAALRVAMENVAARLKIHPRNFPILH